MMRGLRRASPLGLGPLFALAIGCAGEPAEAEEEPARRELLPATGPGPLDALTRRFGRLRQRMRERGYHDGAGVMRMFALEGEGSALPVDLGVSECTTFVAIAGGGVRDLTLALYDGEGREAATDAVPQEGALVHVCPQGVASGPPTAPYHLVLRSLAGSGSVVAGAFASEPETGRGFDGLFDGLLAPDVPVRAVEEALAERRTALRQRGMLPLGEPILDRLAEGEELRGAFVLEVGRCYVATARGDAALTDIDLIVYDGSGTEVARDVGSDAEPDVEVCPDEPGRHAVHALAFSGAGAIGLLVVGGPAEPVEPPPSAEPPPDGVEDDAVAALRILTSALEDRGYAQPVVMVPDGEARSGEVRTHTLVLPPGCSIVVGAAGRRDTDLDLYLADGRGSPLDSDTGVRATARVGACVTEPTRVRVSAKAYGPRSSYALASLAAPDGMTEMSSLRLDEATAAFQRTYARRTLGERAMEARESYREPLSIPAGQCVAVAVAGAPGVEDVDLLVRERGTGRLLVSASGPEPFASVERCAEDVPLDLETEVVVYRGSGVVTVVRMEGAAP